MIEVTVHSEHGRPGPGARYHCVHAMGEFTSWVADWEPFRYLSNQFVVFFDARLRHHETYELTEVEGGCELRYSCGHVYDPEHPEVRLPDADVRLLELYVPGLDHWYTALAEGVARDPGQYS